MLVQIRTFRGYVSSEDGDANDDYDDDGDDGAADAASVCACDDATRFTAYAHGDK